MRSSKSLALYQTLIPELSMPGKRRKYITLDPAYRILNEIKNIAIFDCRALPVAFVDDTGDAVAHELEQTREEVHLPFPVCYFEFADEPSMVLAIEVQEYEASEETITALKRGEQGVYQGHEIEMYDLAENVKVDSAHTVFTFVDDDGVTDIHRAVNLKPQDKDWRMVGKRVLAIITLLKEQFVIHRMQPDPTPNISKERERTQKLPVSGDTHVLTVNVPRIRYETIRVGPYNSTHESPALHWRRGHWRVYFRGSNHEKRSWVRRCLVGDPAKGYTRSIQYRLVHRPEPLRLVVGGRR